VIKICLPLYVPPPNGILLLPGPRLTHQHVYISVWVDIIMQKLAGLTELAHSEVRAVRMDPHL
jgi:hypothetical protein